MFDSTNSDASLVTQFFAFPTQANIGVNVAVGVTALGVANTLITGATIGAPLVKSFAPNVDPANPDAALQDSFYAYDPSLNIGVNVAAADFENNGFFDILTGANAGAPHYRLVKGFATGVMPSAVNGIGAIPFDFQGGVSVGV